MPRKPKPEKDAPKPRRPKKPRKVTWHLCSERHAFEREEAPGPRWHTSNDCASTQRDTTAGTGG